MAMLKKAMDGFFNNLLVMIEWLRCT
jgi:hypothetical protein